MENPDGSYWVKVADFELAEQLPPAVSIQKNKIVPPNWKEIHKGIFQSTKTENVIGSLAYITPERAALRKIRNGYEWKRNEVHTLANITYEVITGQRPYIFPGTQSQEDVIHNILYSDGLPESCVQNVQKALAEAGYGPDQIEAIIDTLHNGLRFAPQRSPVTPIEYAKRLNEAMSPTFQAA